MNGILFKERSFIAFEQCGRRGHFFDKPQTVPVLSKTIPVTSYTFQERKREGGKKISSKEMGVKGRDFLPPIPFYMTSLESPCSKLGQFGVCPFFCDF